VWSPGPIPKDMTLAKMYKPHKSYPANPLLAYAMFLRKYVEQIGTGTGDIIARCREWGLPDPLWRIDDGDDFVTVIYRPQSSVKSSVKSVDKTVDKTVDKSADNRAGGAGPSEYASLYMLDGWEGARRFCTPVATARQLLHSVVGGYAVERVVF